MRHKLIARQPILDSELRIFAYELLFRGGPQNAFQPYANATASVVADTIALFDLKMLTGRALAFINVDEVALQLDAVRLLPAERTVVEILETVRPTKEILTICGQLRLAGYQIALDDFIGQPEAMPFLEFANYLKVDFQLLDSPGRQLLAAEYKDFRLLAEKVETHAEMQQARDLGFSYFQGYFFCKPALLETSEIPGSKIIQFQLLGAASAAEPRIDLIEDLLKQEPSLLYRLLRYLNSPVLSLPSEIHDVRNAIATLGETVFLRWVSIFAVISLGSGKPPELIRTALIRAFFCEQFSQCPGLQGRGASLFQLGLLSITDALLDKPIEQGLRSMPVSQEVKSALTGGANRFRDVYELLLALEGADWPQLSALAQKLDYPEENIPLSYELAIEHAAAIGA
jgi:c-di-GMP-related signal transduction protein